jgi:hypothetical protein
MSAARSRTATRRAAAELLAHRRRLLELAVDPDHDPGAALLLRIEPAVGTGALAELALERAIGRDGEEQAGGEDYREALLGLRAAALAIERDSADERLSTRCPLRAPQRPDLRPTADADPFSGGEGESATVTSAPLPVGEGKRNQTHRRGN